MLDHSLKDGCPSGGAESKTLLDVSEADLLAGKFMRDREELNRKLELLANNYKRYMKSSLRPAIAKAHRHMFSLDVDDFSMNKSRSGLIVTEKLLGNLLLSVKEEKLREAIHNKPNIRIWATHAYNEWRMSTRDARNGPGRWWLFPVLYEFLQEPGSTIRSVIIGLEHMGMIETKPAYSRPTAKSRAKAVRITDRGEKLFQELRNKSYTIKSV